ncbi:MAG TPA: hypothetical protein PK239_04860, partial [Chitinophagales bacterium]|nr:hypothetical protein [Chitinophagales bacterium]
PDIGLIIQNANGGAESGLYANCCRFCDYTCGKLSLSGRSTFSTTPCLCSAFFPDVCLLQLKLSWC